MKKAVLIQVLNFEFWILNFGLYCPPANGRVLAVNHKNFLFDLDAFDFINPDGKRIEAKGF